MESQNGPKKVEYIHRTMQFSKIYWNLKSLLYEQLKDSKIDTANWKREFVEVAMKSRIEEKLKNLVNDVCKKKIKTAPIKTDKNEFVNAARQKWTEFIMQNLIHTSNKLLMNMTTHSKEKESDPQNPPPQSTIQPIYDAGNLFNACISITNFKNKIEAIDFSLHKTLIKCKFDVMKLEDMKKVYNDLSPKNKNLITIEDDPDFVIEREKQADLLIEKGLSSELELFARRGVPVGYRTKFYNAYLGIEITNNPKTSKMLKHYKAIHEVMGGHKIILDELIKEDAREVLNDDRYFIFDEMLDKVLWTFLRDKEVYDDLAIIPIIPLNPLEETNKIIPLSGIIPCRGFARYAVPFCYNSEKPEEVYGLFREFYCKYFCFLNSISSHPNSILRLCNLFEQVLIQADALLYKHCCGISCDPLRVAFPWIMYCFIGYLDIEQIFGLLDRIIGYNSLDIVAILAAAVFTSNSESVQKCKSFSQVEELFHNLYEIKVVEVIRGFLWK